MAQPSDGTSQLPPNQGTVFNSKERDFFRALWPNLSTLPRFLLSGFFGICFSMKCSEILTGSRPDEAMAELFFTIVTVIVLALRMKGTNGQAPNDLVRGVMQIGSNIQLLFLCSFGLMTNGAHAEHQTAGIQSCALVNPNVWETRDYVKAAVVITLLAGLLAIAGGVARSIITRRRQVPAVPAAVPAFSIIPALQKNPAPFPIIPAIPAAEGSVPGNDIDDVLARSPFPTKNNSPLSWL